MRTRSWTRLLDRSSVAISTRQLRTLGMAVLAGVAGVGIFSSSEWDKSASAAPAFDEGIPTAPLQIATGDAKIIRAAPVALIDPTRAGLDPELLDAAVAAVRKEVQRGAFPGAVLGVGRGDGLVLLEGIGAVSWGGGPVDPKHTVYDLASLTKVVATTTAVMLLVEDGAVDLDAPVQRYLPEFSGGAKSLVTVRHLLTHTSGLPASSGVEGLPAADAMRKILHTPLKEQPGDEVEYSDLGFVVLGAAVERAAGQSMAQLLESRIFAPLAMYGAHFLPAEGCGTCAPTLEVKNASFQGVVHDPIARALGGMAGNAGLFSTAADLARFASMLANGGELEGVRVLQEETIRRFTERQPNAETRALGWDTPERNGTGAGGMRISPRAFGHTGYTGTSLWVDPDRGTWTILLTNRTYEPRAPNRIQALRRSVNDDVALAATSDSLESATSESNN